MKNQLRLAFFLFFVLIYSIFWKMPALVPVTSVRIDQFVLHSKGKGNGGAASRAQNREIRFFNDTNRMA